MRASRTSSSRVFAPSGDRLQELDARQFIVRMTGGEYFTITIRNDSIHVAASVSEAQLRHSFAVVAVRPTDASGIIITVDQHLRDRSPSRKKVPKRGRPAVGVRQRGRVGK